MKEIIRLLLDQGVPRDTAQDLRAGGIDAVHVGDLGMSAATDIQILEAARAREAATRAKGRGIHAPAPQYTLAVRGRPVPRVHDHGETAQDDLPLFAYWHSGRVWAVLNRTARPARARKKVIKANER